MSLAFKARPALALLLLNAPFAAAQDVVIVPLDPAPGFDDSSLLPTEPVTGLVPIDDLDDDFQPFGLAPIDPDLVAPEGSGDGSGLAPVIDDGSIGFEPIERLGPGSVVGQDVTTVQDIPVTAGTGAVLKGLDKLAGTVEELRLAHGDTVALGWLAITLGECRFPVDNPSGDAYAWIDIVEDGTPDPVFSGWMIASSPGLNALDHPRFDVWVLGCTSPEIAEAGTE